MRTKFIKFSLLFAVCLGAGFSSYGQAVTGYWLEVVGKPVGEIEGFDLTGYTTYDLYVTTEDCTVDVNTISGYGDCADPSVINMWFDFPGNVFQDPNGGPDVYSFISACDPTQICYYDSYVTIGQYFFGDGTNNSFYTNEDCPGDALATTFEGTGPFDGGDIEYTQGWWGFFGTDDDATLAEPIGCSGLCGVRIMRFTTNGDMSLFDLNFLASGAGFLNIPVTTADGDPDPCDMLNPVMDITTDILCFGDIGEVTITTNDDHDVCTFEMFEVDTMTGVMSDPILQEDGVFSNCLGGLCYQAIVINDAGCCDTTDFVCFPDPDEFSATLTLTDTILCFGDVAQVCFDTIGGTPGGEALLIYESGLVHNSIPDPDGIHDGCFENLVCGDYSLEIEDANGCFATADITIDCVEELDSNIDEIDLLCFNDFSGEMVGVVTGGSGEITADWIFDEVSVGVLTGNADDGDVDVTIGGLEAGEYTLEVIDGNDCEYSATYEIFEPDSLIITATGTDVTCAGLCNGSISTEVIGGTPNYNIVCSEGEDELCEGGYECIVTDDNGCIAMDSVYIIEPLPIDFDFEFSLVSCFDACDGSIEITNFEGGVGDVEVTLTPDAGTFLNDYPALVSFSNLCAGPYTVTISDNDGACTIDIPVEITQPEELIGDFEITNITCAGDGNGIVEVDCDGGTGVITVTGFGTSDECPVTYEDLSAGEYMVVLTDESGCTYEETVEVDVPNELTLEITSGPTTVSCGGENDAQIGVEENGGTEPYDWEYIIFNEGTLEFDTLNFDYPSQLNNLGQNDVGIIITDENGCQATVNFTIDAPPIIVSTELVDQITCTGMTDGSAQVILSGGTAPLEIEYDDFPLPDFDNLPEGIYYFTVTDALGCVHNDSIVMEPLIISDMELEIFTTPVTCWNEDDGTATAAVTGGVMPITYEWNDLLDQTTDVAVGLINDTYQVIVEDAQGCILFANDVVVEMNVGCLFIADALSPNGDGYNDDWVVGGLEYFPNSTVQVYNRWGQLLFESKGYPISWDGTFDGKKLPMADYHYVIIYDPLKNPIIGTVTIKY